MLSQVKRELTKGGKIVSGEIAIPRFEVWSFERSTSMLQSEEGLTRQNMVRAGGSLDWHDRIIFCIDEDPFVRGERSAAHLDSATNLKIAFVSQIGKWHDHGRARDNDGAIFGTFNYPLSKRAGQQQAVELVIKTLYITSCLGSSTLGGKTVTWLSPSVRRCDAKPPTATTIW